jgi:hypothetical protein
MTSRTFPLSRQRRRRILKPHLMPTQEDLRNAAPSEPDPLGDPEERSRREHGVTPGGDPIDPATHSAGARPAAARLPHEHDEYTDPPQPPRPVIRQAGADLEAGLEDTDLRGSASRIIGEHAKRRDGH